jgi:hypothetical protein
MNVKDIAEKTIDYSFYAGKWLYDRRAKAFYILPGYGIYKEIKKPKDKRRIHSFIGWGLYSSGAVPKAVMLLSYIPLGIYTGNWRPTNSTEYLFQIIKNKKEIKCDKKDNKLEKTFYMQSSTTNSENNSKIKPKSQK